MTELLHRRLHTQHLCGPALAGPTEVIGWFGAMQSQEYAAAKWSVAQRASDIDETAMQRAIDDGAILRTHLLRPTWHFVLPADIVWMQRLTAPRVNRFNGTYNRKVGLDDEVFARGNALITKALAGANHLTRAELKAILESGGIATDGLRLALIMMRAELDALICNGVMRGKQHTYALVSERAPDAVELAPDAALAELTRRYFTSHGPATVRDFVWWSSLTATQVRHGLQMLEGELVSEEIDGRTYWSAPPRRSVVAAGSPTVVLLQVYDEYIVSYTEGKEHLDRAGVLRAAIDNQLRVLHAITIDGQIVGTYKRTVTKKALTVDATILVPIDDAQRQAVQAAADRYGQYFGAPATVSYPATP
jgi:hypothetical protein